jgi:chaperonin cofactor prefoldin
MNLVIKSIYTRGTVAVQTIERDSRGRLSGIFLGDGVRFNYTVADGALSYAPVNPGDLPDEDGADFMEDALDFARLKLAGNTKQVKACKKGYACGYTCISQNRNCRKPLPGQARTAAEWVAQQESVKQVKGYKGLTQKAEQRFEKELKAMDDAIATLSRKNASLLAEKDELRNELSKLMTGYYKPDPDASPSEKERLGNELRTKDAQIRNRLNSVIKAIEDNEQESNTAFDRLKTAIVKEVDASASQSLADKAKVGSPSKLKPYSPDLYKQELVALHAITGNKVSTLEDVTYKQKRAYADRPRPGQPGIINVGRSSNKEDQIRMFWHEFGHHLEYSNPDYRDAATEWRKSRASSDTPVKLRSLAPGRGYRNDEQALPGKFINLYVGKVSSSGSTEVISMGLERFSRPSDMRDFYSKDREHFLLILGMLG